MARVDETARDLTKGENITLSIGHYLKNMPALTNQWNDHNHKDPYRQRIYLKDIDCPPLWHDKVKEQIPPGVFYLNDCTGDIGGPGSVEEPGQSMGGRKGRGIARAGDLMSCLPPAMRADNLMCYIGHEGTYTPAHREMCASLGQNIMVETSGAVDEGGIPTKPGSSIWFMTETKDRHLVSEYWLSTLGHDIEIEKHYAQINAWKAAPFTTYIVEQKVGDFILIPPLAPHQVWNRGTRTMKVAWNRTTVETLEMALNEALPRARMVCRDEQYKNKAIILFSLQKYSQLLDRVDQQKKATMDKEECRALKFGTKIRQLQKDFKRLHILYTRILLSEMFGSDAPAEKHRQYLPYDSNVTCSYCRCNIFNRFLTCTSCVIENPDGEDDTYDICMECYAMGRSCRCISKLVWVEQFPWADLVEKHNLWRHQIINFEEGLNGNSPQPLQVERQRMTKKTLAEVCQEQLKARPFRDPKKETQEEVIHDEPTEEEELNADGAPKKKRKVRRSAKWLKEHVNCHICKGREPTWKLAICKCGLAYCYGSLWRAFDIMPQTVMEDPKWKCPRCRKICSCAGCRNDPKMNPFEPTGTILGHDTRHVADPRSVESLVDFSHSNISWVQKAGDDNSHETRILQRRRDEAKRAKMKAPILDHNYVEETPEQRPMSNEHGQLETEHEIADSQEWDGSIPIDPQLMMMKPATANGHHGSSDGDYESTSSKVVTSNEDHEPVSPQSPEARRRMKKAAAQALQAMDSLSQLERNPGDFMMQAGLGNETEVEEDGHRRKITPIASMIDHGHYTTVGANGITYEYPDPTLPQFIPTTSSQAVPMSASTEIPETQISFDSNSKKRKRVSFHAEAVDSSSVADSQANARFKNAQIQSRIVEARKNDRSISVNAALTGKSLILKLPVCASSLARLNEDSPGEHVSTQSNDTAENYLDRILLKSDFNVRQSGGHTTKIKPRKKIIQQVEKDDDFTTRKPRSRRSSANATSAVRTEKVEYNEASEDTDDGEALLEMSTQTKISGTATKERPLPKYLARRNEAEGTPLAELPSGSGRKTRSSNQDLVFHLASKKHQENAQGRALHGLSAENGLKPIQPPVEPLTQSTQTTSVTLLGDSTPRSTSAANALLSQAKTTLPDDAVKQNERAGSHLDAAATGIIENEAEMNLAGTNGTPSASAEIMETPPASQPPNAADKEPVKQPGKRGRPRKSEVRPGQATISPGRKLGLSFPHTINHQDLSEPGIYQDAPSQASEPTANSLGRISNAVSNGTAFSTGSSHSCNSVPMHSSENFPTDLQNPNTSSSKPFGTEISASTVKSDSALKAPQATFRSIHPRHISTHTGKTVLQRNSAEANRLAKMRAWADSDSSSHSTSTSDSESVIPSKKAKTSAIPMSAKVENATANSSKPTTAVSPTMSSTNSKRSILSKPGTKIRVMSIKNWEGGAVPTGKLGVAGKSTLSGR